jgi:methyl-accepting chemotaxis protein
VAKFNSLRARLLAPTLTLSVLVMAGVVAGGATVIGRHQSEAFEEQAARKIEFVATVGVPYITNYDLTALGLFVKELSRDKQVVFAEFFDAEGKSLTADVAASPKDTSGLLLIERDMKDASGKTVGRLKSGFRSDSVVAARDLVLGTISVSMLAVLAVVAGLLLWSVRQVMKTIGAEPDDAVAFADGIAAGDLTRNAKLAGMDSSSLMSALARMQQQLRPIVGNIREAAGSIQVSSAEIAQGHADLSSRTEQQASSLEETAASMEEMTATVSQNAENAKKASQHASAASDVAARGGQAVGAVVSTMSGISESSKKIADIIGVIDGIAFQTNILALNAAVEAARAGEQGRGFAVVASEVRSLAQRSAAAAKEIRQLISDSVGRIDEGSRQVEHAGETMAEVVDTVRRVNKRIAEISAASQEQSQSLTQVSDTMQQLEKVTQQNAAMVEEATAASASLEEQASALTRAVGSFKLAEARGTGPAAAPAAMAAPRAAPQHSQAQKVAALPKREGKAPVAELPRAREQKRPDRSRAKEEGWEEF